MTFNLILCNFIAASTRIQSISYNSNMHDVVFYTPADNGHTTSIQTAEVHSGWLCSYKCLYRHNMLKVKYEVALLKIYYLVTKHLKVSPVHLSLAFLSQNIDKFGSNC